MSFRTRYEEKSSAICKSDYTGRRRFIAIARNDNFFVGENGLALIIDFI
jgi:hypothetical protein